MSRENCDDCAETSGFCAPAQIRKQQFVESRAGALSLAMKWVVAFRRGKRQLHQYRDLDERALVDLGLTHDEVFGVQTIPADLYHVRGLIGSKPLKRGLRQR
jgi:hypothetical protein